jgi:hypothetical protein
MTASLLGGSTNECLDRFEIDFGFIGGQARVKTLPDITRG